MSVSSHYLDIGYRDVRERKQTRFLWYALIAHIIIIGFLVISLEKKPIQKETFSPNYKEQKVPIQMGKYIPPKQQAHVSSPVPSSSPTTPASTIQPKTQSTSITTSQIPLSQTTSPDQSTAQTQESSSSTTRATSNMTSTQSHPKIDQAKQINPHLTTAKTNALTRAISPENNKTITRTQPSIMQAQTDIQDSSKSESRNSTARLHAWKAATGQANSRYVIQKNKTDTTDKKFPSLLVEAVHHAVVAQAEATSSLRSQDKATVELQEVIHQVNSEFNNSIIDAYMSGVANTIVGLVNRQNIMIEQHKIPPQTVRLVLIIERSGLIQSAHIDHPYIPIMERYPEYCHYMLSALQAHHKLRPVPASIKENPLTLQFLIFAHPELFKEQRRLIPYKIQIEQMPHRW